jgi:hypothetical protein
VRSFRTSSVRSKSGPREGIKGDWSRKLVRSNGGGVGRSLKGAMVASCKGGRRIRRKYQVASYIDTSAGYKRSAGQREHRLSQTYGLTAVQFVVTHTAFRTLMSAEYMAKYFREAELQDKQDWNSNP